MLHRSVPPSPVALLTALTAGGWGQQPAPTILVAGVDRRIPADATTLDLGGTEVTDAEVTKLRRALPGCQVSW